MDKETKITLATGFALILLALCALPAFGETKAAPPVNVAMVNGTAITKKAFDQEVRALRARMARQGQLLDDSQLKALKPRILDQLIGSELLYQEAKKDGMKVPSKEVNAYMDRIKKRFPSEADFQRGLSQMHTTESELSDKVKRSLMIQKLIKKNLLKGVSISDAEAKAFYDSHPKFFFAPEMVKASHILIKVSPTASKAEKAAALKKIKEIQAKAKKGADFAELAKTYSQDPSASRGGDLGYFTKRQMVKPFADAAFALAPGQMSGIVKTQYGYHLIKVMDKKAGGPIPFETAKDRIKENLMREKSGKIISQHIKELMKTAKIQKFI